MRTIVLPWVLLLSTMLNVPAHADPSKNILKLVITGDKLHPGEAIIQTGFRLAGTDGIITALHGVVGEVDITAFNSVSSYPTLSLAKVDVANDLALLLPPKGTKTFTSGLTANHSLRLMPRTLLEVHGHPLGMPLNIKSVRVGKPPFKPLSGTLPSDRSGEAFHERRSPHPNIRVLYIEGSLSKGHSGAPVIDSSGTVRAVVNGGLRDGGDISWAIPITQIRWTPASGARVRLDSLKEHNPDDLFSFLTLAELERTLPIVVADFTHTDERTGGDKLQITRLIVNRLTEAFSGLGGIAVKRVRRIIDDRYEALRLGREQGARIVVWGSYVVIPGTKKTILTTHFLPIRQPEYLNLREGVHEQSFPVIDLADIQVRGEISASSAYAALYTVGLYNYERGDYAQAVESFHRALRLPKSNHFVLPTDVRLRLGNAYLAMGRVQEAIGAYDDVLLHDPASVLALANRASARFELRDFIRAESDVNAALKLEPENSIVLNTRGNIYSRSGREELAILDFSRALAYTPHYQEALINRANSYLSRAKSLRTGKSPISISTLMIERDHKRGIIGNIEIADFTLVDPDGRTGIAAPKGLAVVS